MDQLCIYIFFLLEIGFIFDAEEELKTNLIANSALF